MEQSEQHLDFEAVTQLKEIMEDEFAALVDSYISDASQKLELLQAAIGSADAQAVRMEGHSFKGSSRNLGAVRLGDLLAEVEQAGVTEVLTNVPELLQQIEVEFDQVKVELAAMK